jgi:cytochrome c biogenesis protein CcdA/tetratricopeptide (TPR) repeat protein
VAAALACLVAAGVVASAGDEADPILQYALQSAGKMEQPAARASALLLVANAYAKAGSTSQARAALNEAAAVALQSTDPARLLVRIGRAYLALGLPEEALAIAEKVTDSGPAVELLLALADACRDAPAGAGAEGVLRCMDRLLGQAAEGQPGADLLAVAAQVNGKLGRRERAAELLQRAQELCAKTQDPIVAGRLLRGLVPVAAELDMMEQVRRMTDSIRDPAERMGALLQAAVLEAGAGRDDESARLQEEARAVGQQMLASRQMAVLWEAVAGFTRLERRDLALRTVQEAEPLADGIKDSDEKKLALQETAVRYGDLGQWQEAARLGARSNDPYSECKYRANVIVELDAQGRTEEAQKALAGLDTRYIKYVGYQKLSQLAQVYRHSRPDASLEEVNALQPVEFRDGVLALSAQAAAEAGDPERALAWARSVASEGRREEEVLKAAETFLKAAPADRAPAALGAAGRALDMLTSDYRKSRLLFQVASKRLDVGDDAGAADAIRKMGELQQPVIAPETTAETQCRIGILQQRTGRPEEALKNIQESIELAAAIGCASCRDEALENMLQDMLSAGQFGLLEQTVRKLDMPEFLVSACLSLVKTTRGLTEEQKAFLLRSALAGATQMPVEWGRVESVANVALAYAQAGVRPGDAEKEVLRAAKPLEAQAAAPRPAPPPAVKPSGPEASVVRLAYFTRPGCPKCREAEKTIEKVRARLTGLTVEIRKYDLTASAEAVSLNQVLCEQMGVPRRDRLLAPAIFSSLVGLVGTQITEENVTRLAEEARGLPAPQDFYAGKAPRHTILDEYRSLKLVVVLSAGLADGINPCAFTVIIFFLSYLAYIGKRKREIIAAGTVYTAAVFATYFAIGLGLSQLISVGEHWFGFFRRVLYGGIAVLTLVAALLSFRDALLCLKGRAKEMVLALPDSLKTRIRRTISQRARLGLTVSATVVLGGLVAFFEFPCTGQIYLPIVSMLHQPGYFWGPAGWLLLYNLCFILPLIVVFAAVFFGLTSEKLTALFQRHMAKTKFAMAAVFAALFVVLGIYAV